MNQFAATPTERCKICQTEVVPLFQTRVLGKHPVRYFRCPHCGFVQTEAPFWLEEAYHKPITSSDVGYVGRNVGLAAQTAAILSVCLPGVGRCVDFGGGYGMFVRLMRDYGYDFYLLDKYCPNLFAAGFEASEIPGRSYDLLTAFEVFEHLNEPIKDFEQMLGLSDRILLSTELVTPEPPPTDAWNYYGFEHGQHIALFSLQTLRYLAERYRLHLYSSPSKTLHLFSRRPISRFWWTLVFRRGSRWLIKRLGRRPPSLLTADYERAAAK